MQFPNIIFWIPMENFMLGKTISGPSIWKLEGASLEPDK